MPDLLDGIKGSIGFLTTLPVGRDIKSFEAFRRRTYLMPIAGLLNGILLSILSAFLYFLDLKFLLPLAIIAVEGINHFDGLLDFGDAILVPKDKKKEVLKDLNVGAGGCFLAVLWVVCLAFSGDKLNFKWIVLTSFSAEILAKISMLTLISTTNPLWEGMGSIFMEFSNTKTLITSIILITPVFLILQFYLKYGIAYLFIITIIFSIMFREYITKSFGGSNGDIFGATNCLSLMCVFLSSVVLMNIMR